MKILIISIGKKHDDMIRSGVLEFEKRLSKEISLEWKIISSSNIKDEGEKILKVVQDTDDLIVLDQKGKTFTTEGFAHHIQNKLNQSTRRFVFVIGGSYGLDQSILDKASLVWSLSDLTFPHQLVRLILVEQIYRTFSVLKGGKYHHE